MSMMSVIIIDHCLLTTKIQEKTQPFQNTKSVKTSAKSLQEISFDENITTTILDVPKCNV